MVKIEDIAINQLVKITADVIDQKDQKNLKNKIGMIYEINGPNEVIIKIERRTPLPFSIDEFEPHP